jgi:ATP-binding cassette subfamily F protein uup
MGYLKDFLFDESQARSPCRVLSGGERNRLLLARLFARPSNLMVLDEPTNDLDMDTLDVLGDALEQYAGTLLVVSHDRDFLDRTVTSTIAFEPGGRLVEYAGGWSDMLRQRGTPPVADDGAPPAKAKTAGGRDFTTAGKEQRRRERDAAKAEREVERLHEEIRKVEARLADGTLSPVSPRRRAHSPPSWRSCARGRRRPRPAGWSWRRRRRADALHKTAGSGYNRGFRGGQENGRFR